MRYLLDTNVVSESYRGRRTNPAVEAWLADVDPGSLSISSLVLAELRIGAQRFARRDARGGALIGAWVDEIRGLFADRTFTVDTAIAERWARLSVPDPLPFVDGILAATALEHDLTLVTRNTKDVERTGVKLLNPFRPR